MTEPNLDMLDSTLDLDNLLKEPEPLKKLREKKRVLTQDDLISNFPLLITAAPFKNIHDLINKVQFWGHEMMPRLGTLELIENCTKLCQKKRMRIYKEEYQRNARYNTATLNTPVGNLGRTDQPLENAADNVVLDDYLDNNEDLDLFEDDENEFEQDEAEFDLMNSNMNSIVAPVKDALNPDAVQPNPAIPPINEDRVPLVNPPINEDGVPLKDSTTPTNIELAQKVPNF